MSPPKAKGCATSNAGDQFLELFTNYASFSSEDRILDVGRGIGRMARPLRRVLAPQMGSDGFDIVAESIARCREHYRNTPVPFRLAHVDLHNSE